MILNCFLENGKEVDGSMCEEAGLETVHASQNTKQLTG